MKVNWVFLDDNLLKVWILVIEIWFILLKFDNFIVCVLL